MTIQIVDYGRGNLYSLSRALTHLNIEHIISDNPQEIISADQIILPGVGAFGDAMNGLKERGLDKALISAAQNNSRILGICVGCQLLLTIGEEFGRHFGLDIISGTVKRIPDYDLQKKSATRVPNVGWCQISIHGNPEDFSTYESEEYLYFVHSYAPFVEKSEHITASIHINGADVPIAIRKGNVCGVQFHPEKSGPAGLQLLKHLLKTDIKD